MTGTLQRSGHFNAFLWLDSLFLLFFGLLFNSRSRVLVLEAADLLGCSLFERLFHDLDRADLRCLADTLVSDAKQFLLPSVKLLVELVLAFLVPLDEALLWCNECNEAAIALYRAYGFTVEGRRRGFYTAPREDAYVMLWHNESA